ncbi:MAG: hypothetical protein IJD70_02555 [Clostridia bacterium]|nr:hypothetical protein [Clostridia bacterium]
MEIKCKVEITLTDELMEALHINNDTIVIASIHDGVVTLEFENEDEYEDEYDEDNCCSEECQYCEYYCRSCGTCKLDE